jgi:hypothetical protein
VDTEMESLSNNSENNGSPENYASWRRWPEVNCINICGKLGRYKCRITAIWKVEKDIITKFATSPIGWSSILVLMYA